MSDPRVGTDKSYQDALKRQLAILQAAGDVAGREERLRRGSHLQLRHGQSHRDAVAEIKADHEDLMQTGRWVRRFNYRPVDGMNALMEVLKETFGSVSTPGTMGFFGPNPPVMIDIEVGVGEYKQVVADAMQLPCLEDVTFYLGSDVDEEKGELFQIVAEGKKIFAGEVQVIFNLVGDYLERNSIYRGKAIDDGFHFLDLRGVDPSKVVYSELVQTELETNIFSRLRYPEVLVEHGVQLKGAVLLEGTFGTGKTLAAYLTAREAVENGWGFILVRPEHLAGSEAIDTFQRAMQTAALYGRTVIFVEDVDTLTSADQEASRISRMLDLFDGARAKGQEVLAVLTTNHAEAITPGMVRPGRIDAVITITAPDAPGIVRLCKVLVQEGLLDEAIPAEGEDFPNGEGRTFGWDDVSEAMAGFIPAAISEACSRAVRYMIVRNNGHVNGSKITAEDLVRAAQGLVPQMELLERAIAGEPERDMLGERFRYEVEAAVDGIVGDRLPVVITDVMQNTFGLNRVR